MTTLDRLHLLVHGFCYHGLARKAGPPDRRRPFLEREIECAKRWRSRVAGFTKSEALAIIPFPVENEEASDFLAMARSALGERCLLLDGPDAGEAGFWSDSDAGFREAILAELRAAFAHREGWSNREELDTDLHCLSCACRLKALLRERNLTIDAETLLAEGWGASFEGCVMKYTVILRRMLGLKNPIGVDFAMTVPDAGFLLPFAGAESLPLPSGLRVFLWQGEGEPTALYTITSHSLDDGPAAVRLPPALRSASVRSKQGIRLWPDGEGYELPGAPRACREPAQCVVSAAEGGIEIPATAGFVYRLAKAPAYVIAPPGMSQAEYRRHLLAALPAERKQPGAENRP